MHGQSKKRSCTRSNRTRYAGNYSQETGLVMYNIWKTAEEQNRCSSGFLMKQETNVDGTLPGKIHTELMNMACIIRHLT